MARRNALPNQFAEIHPRNLIPARATIWAGVLSVIWFVAISILSSNVLADCVAGLGFLVCIYYGFTGFACSIFYRYELLKSVRNFISLRVMPTLGGLALMGVLGRGVVYYGTPTNDYSPPFLGLGVPGLDRDPRRRRGIVFVLIAPCPVAPAFFQRAPGQVFGDSFEIGHRRRRTSTPASSML